MSARGVRRLGASAVTVGGAVAAAAMLGSGSAQAAPGDDVVDAGPIAATSGSGSDWLWGGDATTIAGAAADSSTATTTSSANLLSTAVTDFADANTVLAGIDVSDAPSQFQSQLSQFIGDQTSQLNTALQLLTDSVGPGEATVLADSGPLSTMIDQWFFDPLNQNWADAGTALLTADQGLHTAVASGAESDITSALQQVDVAESQVLPAEFESIPLIFLGDLFGDGAGDAAATSGLFDLPV